MRWPKTNKATATKQFNLLLAWKQTANWWGLRTELQSFIASFFPFFFHLNKEHVNAWSETPLSFTQTNLQVCNASWIINVLFSTFTPVIFTLKEMHSRSLQTSDKVLNNKLYLLNFKVLKVVLSIKPPNVKQSNYPLYLIVYQHIVTVTIRKCNTVLAQSL